MEYKAKNRKFTLIEQEKIGDALKVKKAKHETDNNEPRRKYQSRLKTKESGKAHSHRLDLLSYLFVHILST